MEIGILFIGLAIGALIAYGIFKPYESKGIDVDKLQEKKVDSIQMAKDEYDKRVSKDRTICEVKEEYEKVLVIIKEAQLKNILNDINVHALRGESSFVTHYPYHEIHTQNKEHLIKMGYILEEGVYESWFGDAETRERPGTKVSGWATADCSQSKPQ